MENDLVEFIEENGFLTPKLARAFELIGSEVVFTWTTVIIRVSEIIGI